MAAGAAGQNYIMQHVDVHDVVNQKAAYLRAGAIVNGKVVLAGTITISDVRMWNVTRVGDGLVSGIHSDFILARSDQRLAGAAAPNLVIQNVQLWNDAATPAASNPQPLYVEADGGDWGTVTIDGLQTAHVGTENKIYAKGAADHYGAIVIKNCPNERFTLGGLGAIGTVTISNSPGLELGQQPTLTVGNIVWDKAPATQAADTNVRPTTQSTGGTPVVQADVIAAMQGRIDALAGELAALRAIVDGIPRAWKVVPATGPGN